jgi:hypothetical protein
VTTYLRYQNIKFRPTDEDLLGHVVRITDEYEGAGYPMTLRQLYYQLVAANLIRNKEESYDRIGRLVSNGRMAGLVSWTAIEDRGRNLMGLDTFRSPREAVKAARATYRRDLWEDQPMRPEVWVEKQALEGVVGAACNVERVDFFATRGYNSQSEAWRAGQRFAGRIQRGQRPVVLYLGDHDPSGIDMTRDVEERLETFCGMPVQVVRIALNMQQIDEVNPPPNPAKVTDSRAAGYIAKYGEHSWELDALTPDYLGRLITRSVDAFRDRKLWDAALAQEARDLDELDNIVEEL